MRLSEWRAAAPNREAAGAKVTAVVDPVLAALGAGPDPYGWVVWGEEPAIRHAILIPTDPGLIVCFVRVMVPGEGPRASAKLVRWNRVAIGELAVEAQHGHRLLSFQLEGQVLRGVDAEADRVAAFALRVIAAVDGRALPPADDTQIGRARSSATSRAKSAPKAATAAATGRPRRVTTPETPETAANAAAKPVSMTARRLGSGRDRAVARTDR